MPAAPSALSGLQGLILWWPNDTRTAISGPLRGFKPRSSGSVSAGFEPAGGAIGAAVSTWEPTFENGWPKRHDRRRLRQEIVAVPHGWKASGRARPTRHCGINAGNSCRSRNADVRKDDDVRALVDKTVARFGRLDVAVNSAGTEGQVGPITDQTAENYAATFDTNVLGVILSMKHEVRAMQGQGSGSIINISSTYGHEGAAGASIYVGSKHAVEGIQLAQPGSVASVIRNERL